MIFKIINRMTPVYLKDMFSKNIGTSCYNLRTSREDIALPGARTDYLQKQFRPHWGKNLEFAIID